MTNLQNQQKHAADDQALIRNFDVVIVGGGIVGTTLACLLEKGNLTVALLDAQSFDESRIALHQKQPEFDARVSAITPASQSLFAEIGIWQDLCQRRVSPYTDMKVWDSDGTGSIHFSAGDINQAELGFIIENSVLQAALYQKLQSLENLELINPARVSDLNLLQINGQQRVQLRQDNGTKVSSRLIVAADGANSKIRQLANFSTREWDYQHTAIVTSVETELAHQDTALQCFMETGPLAFLPLHQPKQNKSNDQQHYSSIVWSTLPEQSKQLMTLSDEQFAGKLAQAMERRLGDVRCLGKRYSFPLRQRHAINYVMDNIVLVGDAAHTIHPLAGQGVNLGLQDVQALAEELLLALAKGRDYADIAVLRRYQRQRIGHNLSMMGLMEGFKHLFAQTALPTRWLRNWGMTKADSITVVKNTLARKAMGI